MGKSEYEDVLQAGGQPSVSTNRGHQCPGAFLVMASGLDKVSTSRGHQFPGIYTGTK